ncbi:MAG TPA: class I SAM-dependent methyltransferase [Roseiarcus sp.]
MSKFDDAIRGLYFRKSRREWLEQVVARIESAHQNSEQAIARIESSQKDSRDAIARLSSEQQKSGEAIEHLKPVTSKTVEEAIDTEISTRAPILTGHHENAEIYRRWYEGMEFSEDWTSDHFGIWAQVFDEHGKYFKEALEIGSFEGRSAIFFLEYLPQLHIICVDLFEYTSEYFARAKPWVKFDNNLSKYAGRYEKIASLSANALAEFASKGRKFDFIYIDGSHTRDNVFIDALLSWKLLNVNGVLIFDDYFWGWHFKRSERPKEAIEYFVYSHLDELKILHKGAQFIIKKVTASKDQSMPPPSP